MTAKKSMLTPPPSADAWIKSAGEAPTNVVQLDKAQETPAVPPAKPKTTRAPAKTPKKAPAPGKPAAAASAESLIPGAYGWLDADDRVPKPFNVRFTERDHAKLLFCRRLSPTNESAHDIAYAAIMAEVHRRIRDVGIDPDRKNEDE